MDKSTLEALILTTLKTIRDPELPINIVDLGLIYQVTIGDNSSIHILMTLTNPGCPVVDDFIRTIRQAILNIDTVSSVIVDLTWEPPWDTSRMTEAARIELNLI
jgi:metal-sulfur cluster biosynthetic enzyme